MIAHKNLKLSYGYVYKTINNVNGNIYIGQHKHPGFDYSYIGSGNLLKRAIKKHGLDNFSCFLLQVAKDKNELDELEKKYIYEYRKTNKLYNISPGGTGGKIYDKNPNLGKKLSEYHRNILSINNSGSNNPMYGIRLKGKLNPMFGKNHSQETRDKIGKALSLNKGKNHGNFGIIRSDKTKEKISNSKGGKVMNKDILGLIFQENSINQNKLPSFCKNIIHNYRRGVYQNKNTMDKNIKKLLLFLNINQYYEKLILNYRIDKNYYKDIWRKRGYQN